MTNCSCILRNFTILNNFADSTNRRVLTWRSRIAHCENRVFLPLSSEPPGPPKKLAASDVARTSCVLTWKAPEFDGGSPVTGYYIEALQGEFSTRWSRVNKAAVKKTTLELSDLIELTQYEFRVVAVNEAGVGAPSNSESVVPKNPFSKPGAPSQPVVSAMCKDAATLSWQPPADDGNSPITGYTVEMRGAGSFVWSAANLKERVTRPTVTVPGLKAGAEYEFRVTAENRAGLGQPSPPSAPAKYGQHPHPAPSLVSRGRLHHRKLWRYTRPIFPLFVEKTEEIFPIKLLT